MESILVQLKKRQVFKVATIYAVSAWTLLQIADVAVPMLGLSDTGVMLLLLKIFIIGFPIGLIFAWLVNFTSDGMVRAGDEHPDQSNYKTNFRITLAVAGSLIVALVITVVSQLLIESPANSFSQQLFANGASSLTPTANANKGLLKDKKKSIAVLPFEVFSKDQEDEFFVDGMVEELLNVLANIPDLRVAARTSSFSYKGVTGKTISEIGQELGVDTILEGSIRKNAATNEIRITAQLIDTNTGAHFWSESYTYDRESMDIFKIQDDIASSVVDKMKITLLDDAVKHEFVAGTDSVDAMVEYGKGQEELTHRRVFSLEKALQHFTVAIDKDSNYARAYVGVADANILLNLYGNIDEDAAKEAARTAIDKALSIDDKLGNAYASRGLLLSPSDPAQAEIAFKRAIELNPNNAMSFMWYGTLLQERGDLSGAHQLYEKALELDPRSPIAANNVAWGHYMQGSEDKAMELFTQIIANDPYYPGAYILAGEISQNRGRLDEAIRMYERALQLDSVNKSAVRGLITASMDMGDVATADHWFAYIEERPELFSHSDTVGLKARYFAAQGEISKAIAYLDQVEFSAEEMKMNLFTNAEKAFLKQDYAEAVNAFEGLRATDQGTQGYFFYMASGRAAAHLAYSYQQTQQPQKADQLIFEHQQFLQNGTGKETGDPDYFYNMALIRSLQSNADESLQYLQGAIDAGWVEIWSAKIEPIFDPIIKQQQFALMIGGVNAKLTNMRTKMEDKNDFLAG